MHDLVARLPSLLGEFLRQSIELARQSLGGIKQRAQSPRGTDPEAEFPTLCLRPPKQVWAARAAVRSKPPVATATRPTSGKYHSGGSPMYASMAKSWSLGRSTNGSPQSTGGSGISSITPRG